MAFGPDITPTALGTAVDGTAGTTLSLASVALNAGDSLIVCVAWDSSTTLNTGQCKYGTAVMTRDVNVTNGATRLSIFRYLATTNDTQTVLITWGSSTNGRAMSVWKISGLLLSPKDASTTATGTSGSPSVGPTAAVVGSKEIVVAAVATTENSDAAAGTWGDGLTDNQRVGTTGSPASSVTVSDGYRIVTATPVQTYRASKSGLASTAWAMGIVTYIGTAITVVAHEVNAATGSFASHTYGFVGGSGTNLVALVGAVLDSADGITGATYGGQAMTLVDSSTGLQVYALANPPSGAQTVEVDFDGTSHKGSILLMVLVDGATPTGKVLDTAGSAATETVTTAATSGDRSAGSIAFLAIQNGAGVFVTPSLTFGTILGNSTAGDAGDLDKTQGYVGSADPASGVTWDWSSQGSFQSGAVTVAVQPQVVTPDDWVPRTGEHTRRAVAVETY